MPIYFRNAPVREPFIYDSIGNHWLQDATSRPNGYPFYHYLQTESGCGRITIQGKSYLLHEQEGVLIAPSIRHSYLAQTPEWYTCFCTFSGTVEGSISKILNNRPILFTTKEQCRNIRALLQDAIQLFEHPPVNIRYSLSTVIRCFYSFRMSRTVRSFFLIRCICAMLLRSSKK